MHGTRLRRDAKAVLLLVELGQLTCTRVGSALSTASARCSSCRQAGAGSTARSQAGDSRLATSSTSASCLQKSRLSPEPAGTCSGAGDASPVSPILLQRKGAGGGGKAAVPQAGMGAVPGLNERLVGQKEKRQGPRGDTASACLRLYCRRGSFHRATMIIEYPVIASQGPTRCAMLARGVH